MVDEDFVLGYVTGYNDGVGSGSGGGSPIPDLVLGKIYPFGNSGYGVAMIDFEKSNFYQLTTLASWGIGSPGPGVQGSRVWGPPTSKIYLWGYARTKGEKIIGVVMSNVTLVTEDSTWSYETGSWVKISGTSPVFGECQVVKTDDSTEYHERYNMKITVDGEEQTQFLADRRMDAYGWNAIPWYGGGSAAHLMTDSDYTAWVKALSENGITLEV